jgi:hypothetical protein
MEIKKEFCAINIGGRPGGNVLRKPVLKNEIEGVNTYYSEFHNEMVYTHSGTEGCLSIFLFTKGAGCVSYGMEQTRVNEIALFIPSLLSNVNISSENGTLGFIEIVMELSTEDVEFIYSQGQKLPFYISYSGSVPYKESIKSNKTSSRMLLPENIIPRLCIGSVETTGPDEVGSHSHPMLEQLFFGLNKNDCTVFANGNYSSFKENELLHIPLGSDHGVVVSNGKILNYIWMDFFYSQEDVGYIADNHKMSED